MSGILDFCYKNFLYRVSQVFFQVKIFWDTLYKKFLLQKSKIPDILTLHANFQPFQSSNGQNINGYKIFGHPVPKIFYCKNQKSQTF